VARAAPVLKRGPQAEHEVASRRRAQRGERDLAPCDRSGVTRHERPEQVVHRLDALAIGCRGEEGAGDPVRRRRTREVDHRHLIVAGEGTDEEDPGKDVVAGRGQSGSPTGQLRDQPRQAGSQHRAERQPGQRGAISSSEERR
jgi:hypothetical protein